MKFLIILLLLLPFFLFSQPDSIPNKETISLKSYILPSSIMLSGILLNRGTTKINIQNKIPRTNTSIDDYLGFVPIGMMYIADLAKIHSKNTPLNQTKYYFISTGFTLGTVLVLKEFVQVERPDHTEFNSFPSGHTAHAFVAANVLFQEYKDSKPILAYSGFVIASATGFLRMTNNRHWISDVLTSVGMATVITQLVYHYEPLKDWNPFDKSKYTIIPNIGKSQVGMVVIF